VLLCQRFGRDGVRPLSTVDAGALQWRCVLGSHSCMCPQTAAALNSICHHDLQLLARPEPSCFFVCGMVLPQSQEVLCCPFPDVCPQVCSSCVQVLVGWLIGRSIRRFVWMARRVRRYNKHAKNVYCIYEQQRKSCTYAFTAFCASQPWLLSALTAVDLSS